MIRLVCILSLGFLISFQIKANECDSFFLNQFTSKLKCLEAINAYDVENPACESLAFSNLGVKAAIGGTFGAYISKIYFKGPSMVALQKKIGSEFANNLINAIAEIRSIQSNRSQPDNRSLRLQEDIAQVARQKYKKSFLEFERMRSSGISPDDSKFKTLQLKLMAELAQANSEAKTADELGQSDKKIKSLIEKKFPNEAKEIEQLHSNSRVLWQEIEEMGKKGILPSSSEYQKLQKKYLLERNNINSKIENNSKLKFIAKLYEIAKQPLQPGYRSFLDIDLRKAVTNEVKTQKFKNTAGNLTKTVMTSGIFSFVGAVGWNAAEKELLNSCQKELDLTDSDINMISGNSYFFSKAKIESKPLANGKLFSCKNIDLDLEVLSSKIDLPISNGLCNMMKKGVGKLDNFIDKLEIDQLEVDCSSMIAPNFSLKGSRFSKNFIYNDGSLHIEAPFNQTLLWPDFSKAEVYSSGRVRNVMETERIREEANRKYVSMKAYDPNSQLWQSDLNSSCTEGSKGTVPCKVIKAAMKARLTYYLNLESCKEEFLKPEKKSSSERTL